MKILTYSLVVVCSLLFGCACIKFHREPTNVELGSHHVSVQPQCDDKSTTATSRLEKDGTSRIIQYELTCGDVTVMIRDNLLTVNGKSYGALTDGDRISIDFDKVRVNSEVRQKVR